MRYGARFLENSGHQGSVTMCLFVIRERGLFIHSLPALLYVDAFVHLSRGCTGGQCGDKEGVYSQKARTPSGGAGR